MVGFDPKEINPPDCDLSSAERSLPVGTYTLLIYLNYSTSLTIGAENQAQCASSPTFSDRGSDFDPNYDNNSALGVSAASHHFQCIKISFLFRQRMTLLILKFAQR